MKVELAEQVVDFTRRLPPEPKRRLRQALRDLVAEKGDMTRFEEPLENSWHCTICQQFVV